MNPEIPARLPAAFFDSLVPALDRAFVSPIHLVLSYDYRLDPDRLRRAVRLLLDAEPVLGCLFKPGFFRPFWSRLSPEDLDRAPVLESVAESDSARADRIQDEFLGLSLDPQTAPPLKVLHCQTPESDRLILKVDHQASDAGGLKHLAGRLNQIYMDLERNPDHRPEINLSRRSQDQILAPYLPGRLPALFLNYLRDLKILFYPRKNLSFPVGSTREGNPVFLTLTLNPERTGELKKMAATREATLNDLTAAAMIRALARTADWDGRVALRLVGTVDLRRYLPEGAGRSVSNLSGWYFLNLRTDLGRDLAETLDMVGSRTSRLKRENMGLAFNLFGYLALVVYPYGIRVPYCRFWTWLLPKLGAMPPTLTNMGLINPGSIDLGGGPPGKAHLLVPPGSPPILTLGLSGYRGSLTLSAGFFESAVSREKIKTLFEAFDQELAI